MAGKEQKREQQEKRMGHLASTIAFRQIFIPDDENLADVSVISTGMVHPLTRLKAYGEQIESVIEQVRARQKWYIVRAIKKEALLNNKDEKWIESEIEKRMNELIENDTPDMENMFIKKLLLAYCHISRGKNGYLLDKGTVLADSDLQTRQQEPDIEVPRRKSF